MTKSMGGMPQGHKDDMVRCTTTPDFDLAKGETLSVTPSESGSGPRNTELPERMECYGAYFKTCILGRWRILNLVLFSTGRKKETDQVMRLVPCPGSSSSTLLAQLGQPSIGKDGTGTYLRYLLS